MSDRTMVVTLHGREVKVGDVVTEELLAAIAWLMKDRERWTSHPQFYQAMALMELGLLPEDGDA